MTGQILQVTNISFGYAKPKAASVPVLQDISLTLSEAEILCLLGPSGCGKTTLLSLIAGLLSPDAGEINLQTGEGKSGQIGYIFQHDALLPWRTVRGNLMLAHDLGKSPVDKSMLDEYLATFHLDQSILDSYPDQLSGGMRQRVSIIQSLMFQPDVLLLDEPFSALDFYTKLRLEGEFRFLAKHHKKATLLVTHDIDEAIAMSDRILIMDGSGRISQELSIQLGEEATSPEIARGTQAFSSYYKQIWQELKAAIIQ